MGNCILLNGGGVLVDTDLLTATPQKVRKGKFFVGADGDQVGEIPDIPMSVVDLPLNGSAEIEPGIHDGNGTITQYIKSMDDVTIYPTALPQTVNTSGTYMSGDVQVAAVSNLLPGNIKKGITIMGVIGTWEGYY